MLFLTADGALIGSKQVGALPDMLTFTPDGSKLLVANEGEPSDTVDPQGSISILDVSGMDIHAVGFGFSTVTVTTADFTAFDGREEELRNRGVRIFPGKSVSQDVEPEYIAVAPDGSQAFVTLQEANAFAVLDIAAGQIVDIVPLGLKDYSQGQPSLEIYPFAASYDELLDLGTTDAGQTIKLGGFSGLWFEGIAANGNYKFLTVPDRGPNPDPVDGQRPFALPDYQARIVEFELDPATREIVVTNQMFLTQKDGTTPITGIPNIPGADEIPIDLYGNELEYDPYGADLEGIVRAPDGTFWMCDEYRPAIYHFAQDGTLIERYVPSGTAALADEPAGTFGAETLPAEYAARVANRGFEAIAYDTDQDVVYGFIQTPLANPNKAASDASNVIRMIGINPATGAPVSEYVYLLEQPSLRQSKVDKIGDAVYTGDGKFMVLERDSAANATGKKYVFEIDLQGATNLLSADRYDPYFLGGDGGYGGSYATDSASAATAISTGYKTDGGNIAWLPGDPVDGDLTTIAESLRADKGFAIGVVSTVPFTHATPAAFVSHNVNRNNYTQIGSEIINTVQPDVVIGGGNRDWGGNYLSAADQAALEGGTTAYTYVGREASIDGGDALLTAAATVDVNSGEKLFGLFGGNGGNFEYHEASDTPGSPSITQGSQENPTLAEAVQASIDVLNDDSDGFFVMFEQGDIDWSNHANDFENMIGGVWDLDQAVRAAEAAVDDGDGGMDWSNTLMIVTSDHSNSYMRNETVLGAGDLPLQVGSSYPDGEVSYGSTGHTNELVTLAARGAAADLFADYAGTWYPGTQILDNSQIYHAMRRAAYEAGVEHILLFIGDGMNIEHEIAASRYLFGQDDALAWHDWAQRPDGWSGFVSTWDVTTYNKYAGDLGLPTYDPSDVDPTVGYDPVHGGIAPYPIAADNVISYTDAGLRAYFLPSSGGGYGSGPATDSASAGTAISTGIKTDSGNIAWLPGDPVGGNLTTIAEKLRDENGFSIGVVSTVPFTHATPAAFVSHNVSRNNYTQIGSEIINTVQPELVIGGGNRDWGGNYLSTADQAALEGGATAYTYVGREVSVDGGDALLTAAATVDVTAGGKLFGLFGGAGGNFEYHEASDTPGSPSVTQGSQENPTLAETVTAAIDVLGDDPDGFFVMFEQGDIDWSNHANDFENMIGGVWDLDQAVRAAEAAVENGEGGMSWSNTLVIVTSDHSNSYMRNQRVLGAGNLPAQVGNAYPDGEVTYSSGGHTNELVSLSARGAGAELFNLYAGSWYPGTELVDNTHIYEVMRAAAQEAGVEHILLFIGDGMNIEHEIAGSRYLYGEDYGLAWNAWGQMQDGWSGFCSTWDVQTYNNYAGALGASAYDPVSFDPAVGYVPAYGGAKPYPLAQGDGIAPYTRADMDAYFLGGGSGYNGSYATDSASAATAMSTGHKTDGGNVAWLPGDPADGDLTTIAEKLRADQGFAIGVVSTVPFTHATPAAFVSHNVNRNNYTQIGSEIIHEVQPEVVIGGGNRDGGGNYLSAADQAALEGGATAYTYVGREASVDGGDALLTAAATVDVTAGGKLFGLFGGAGGNFEYHEASDTPGAPSVTQGSQENPTLAEAVQASIDVLNDDPDGFFVMFEQGDIDWSNHANDFENMIGGVWDLDQAVRAAETAVENGEGGMSWSNTLVIVTSDHSNSYMRNQRVLGAGNLPAQSGSTYPDGEVTYGSGGHTNELVSLWARGAGSGLLNEYAGSWYPGTGIVDNTQIYEVMRRAAEEQGVDHILLFIGDGMNIEHEIAGSRYLYGQDFGLAWHAWGALDDGWAGYSSTWDVTTYGKYANDLGVAPYDASDFDPLVGYDPSYGGGQPYPLTPVNEYMPLTGLTLEQHTAGMLAELNIHPVDKRKVLNLPSIGYTAGDKTEGIALLPDGRLAILNDNDFGLAGGAIPLDGSVLLDSTPVIPTLGIISFPEGNMLDASDKDDAIDLNNWPVFGMYMPDAVASYEVGGQTFYITANEGDDRGEDERIKDLDLAPDAFPNADALQDEKAMGRLAASSIDGDLDGDGDVDRIQVYGGRSFTIWDSYGNLVYDSSDIIAAITAEMTPELFNADEADPEEFDNRSDNKGAEPEGVTVGVIEDRVYAFVGLERAGGGVLVFDVTDPQDVTFVQYALHEGDVAPEGLAFISAENSPNGQPMLAVSNEESNTVTLFQVNLLGSGIEDGRTTSPPYVFDIAGEDGDWDVTPLLTMGDEVPLLTGKFGSFSASETQTYAFPGVPDGIGVFETVDAYYVFVNHEFSPSATSKISSTEPGQINGSRVSLYQFTKDWRVVGGKNLIDRVMTDGQEYRLNPATGNYEAASGDVLNADFWSPGNFGRFCSGYLAQHGFMNKRLENAPVWFAPEENGADARGWAVSADGSAISLDGLGRYSKEQVYSASQYRPNTSLTGQTVLFATEDTSDGEVYMFVGEPTLDDPNGFETGQLYVLRVLDETGVVVAAETMTTDGDYTGQWVAVPDRIAYASGETLSNWVNDRDGADKLRSTNFIRPEDIHEDPKHPGSFYFVTTGREEPNALGALYRFALAPNNPTGNMPFELLLEGGPDTGVSYDNMTVDSLGRVLIQEDRASIAAAGIMAEQERMARVISYNIATGAVEYLFEANQAAIDPSAAADYGNWETSGIVQVPGAGAISYLLDVQAHSMPDADYVQGGQLLLTTWAGGALMTPIPAIQGASHTSPLEGQDVVTSGIVTAVAYNGFYLQDPAGDGNDATSDGIFVYTGSRPSINIGDELEVAGTVSEYIPGGASTGNLSITQLTGSDITVLSTSNDSPAPVILGIGGRPIPATVIDDDGMTSYDPATDGIDFYESLEGMLVQVNNAVVAGPTNYFDEIAILADGGANAGVRTNDGGVAIQTSDFNPERIIIDDGIQGNNSDIVNVGDQFNDAIVGVFSYSFGNSKLFNVDPLPAVTSGGYTAETTTLVAGGDYLTVATFNVENLNPSEDKFDELAAIIVDNLQSPDILGLQEIQDNNGTTDNGVVAADQTYTALIAAIVAAGGPAYEYRQVNPANNADGGAPGSNIRVGYLFNPARVTFVSNGAGGAADATAVSGGHLTLSPGRVDPADPAFAEDEGTGYEGARKSLAAEFNFNGQTVFVINNHLKSKSGDDPLFGANQPPVQHTVAQRTDQAEVIADFVAGLPVDANVIVLGDMNDFEFSAPLAAMQAGRLTNLMDEIPLADRYTYIYDGNSQTLDHILADSGLAADAEIDVVHVNAGLAADLRVSDHDPVVARFLIEAPEPTNLAPTALDDLGRATLMGNPLTINVIANDTDPENDPLSVTAVTQPANGTVVNNQNGTVTFTPTSTGTSTFTYTISDGQGNSDTATVEVAVTAKTLYRVNAGGAQLAGSPAWTADTAASPSPHAGPGGSTYSTTAAISMTHGSIPAGTPAALFQTERWDGPAAPEMQWDFAVQPGLYDVRLYFAEIYQPAAVTGGRTFDVTVEGVLALDNYDAFAAAGAVNRAVMESVEVQVADGNLDIDFGHVVENPALKAIEILYKGASAAGGEGEGGFADAVDALFAEVGRF